MLTKIKASGLTPKDITQEMDKYIIGQDAAKKAVAIAFVNRDRRMRIKDEKLRSEIPPMNVLLFGATGVGKTEIARRVADISDSPFLKVEMTKFTEVGYAGRDVDSIIRDLVELTIKREKDKLSKEYSATAKEMAVKYVIQAIKDTKIKTNKNILQTLKTTDIQQDKLEKKNKSSDLAEELPNLNDISEKDLLKGKYDNLDIAIIVPESAGDKKDLFNNIDYGFPGAIGNATMISIIPLFSFKEGKSNNNMTKVMKVRDALEMMTNFYTEKFLNENLVISDILKKIEQKSVIFLDEIDKLTSNKENHSKGEVSREGVQRDLLPIIEGTTVQTKYGPIKTDHILFIAAGAFYYNKISDLMPELQGRFPVNVKLRSLTVEDFEHILTNLKYNLPEQQQNLLKVDGINIKFTKDGIRAIAEVANRINSEIENTGARRLYSVMEKVVEEISFNGKRGSKLTIDRKYVENAVQKEFDKKIDTKKYTI